MLTATSRPIRQMGDRFTNKEYYTYKEIHKEQYVCIHTILYIYIYIYIHTHTFAVSESDKYR